MAPHHAIACHSVAAMPMPSLSYGSVVFLEPGQPRCHRRQRHPTHKCQTNQRLGLIEVVFVASQSLPKRFKMVHIAQVTKLKSDRLAVKDSP